MGNVISIGLITNNKIKTRYWLFDSKECGMSYELQVGTHSYIYHYKNGKEHFKQSIPGESFKTNETFA